MPEPAAMAQIEIQGLYDGIAVRLYTDGRIENRFGGEEWAGTRRQRQIDDWIAEHGAALRRAYGVEEPSA